MSANQRTKCSASFSRAGRSVTFSPRSNGPNMEAARIAADAAFLLGWRDDLARESDDGLTMRFLVAAGFAILIAATAKAIDVLLTPFGATFDPGLQVPYALSGYVLYGLGLALLFFALAAHFALTAASPQLTRSRAALAAGALWSGVVIAAYAPWSIAMGLRWIIPDEQPRFVIVLSMASLHLV